MKTTKRHFSLFKKHFTRYAEMLGLHDWEIFFFHEELDSCFGSLQTQDYMSDRVVSVTLTTKWCDHVPLTDAAIILTARHEAIELLVDDICSLAKLRFTSEDIISLERHSLVRRLEKVIK